MVSGLGGDGEDNYGDGLTMAAKMVMERWTNYGGEDGDGAKLQVSRRWSTVVEPGDAVVAMNEAVCLGFRAERRLGFRVQG